MHFVQMVSDDPLGDDLELVEDFEMEYLTVNYLAEELFPRLCWA